MSTIEIWYFILIYWLGSDSQLKRKYSLEQKETIANRPNFIYWKKSGLNCMKCIAFRTVVFWMLFLFLIKKSFRTIAFFVCLPSASIFLVQYWINVFQAQLTQILDSFVLSNYPRTILYRLHIPFVCCGRESKAHRLTIFLFSYIIKCLYSLTFYFMKSTVYNMNNNEVMRSLSTPCKRMFFFLQTNQYRK